MRLLQFQQVVEANSRYEYDVPDSAAAVCRARASDESPASTWTGWWGSWALGPTPTLPTYHRRLLRTMPLL
jgi:hypothetical protein